MKGLSQPHLELVGKVMDLQMQRQNVIMSNVANVNTPKYQKRSFEFEKELQQALGLDMNGRVTRTSTEHMPASFDARNFQGDWAKAMDLRVVHGEDRVDVDQEMAKMAKNNLQYNALAQVTKSGYAGLKQIIQEGAK